MSRCGPQSGGGGQPGLFMRRTQTHRLTRPDSPVAGWQAAPQDFAKPVG